MSQSVVEKAIRGFQYKYAYDVVDLIIKGFEEKQIKKDIENPALATLDNISGKAPTKYLQEILSDLYGVREDLKNQSVENNQASGIIVFGFNDNGMQIQDVYLDALGNTEFIEENPAHRLCKIVIDQISEVTPNAADSTK